MVLVTGLKLLNFSDGASYRDPQTGTLFFGGITGDFVAIQADGRPEQLLLYASPFIFDKSSIFGEQCKSGRIHHPEKRRMKC